MPQTRLLFAAAPSFLALAVTAVACGGSTDTPKATEPVVEQDAGTFVPVTPPDAGVIPDDVLNPTYPAPHAPMPKISYHGGRVLHNIQVVTITYAGDPLKERLETFGDTIVASPYWDAISGGYTDKDGPVGRGTSYGHVVLPAEPTVTSYIDSSQGGASSIQDLIKARVADGTFPPPTANSLYAIYYPQSVVITLDGDKSCDRFGAYHNTVMVKHPTTGVDMPAPYAIMPRCGASEKRLTVSASHELTEATTDPDIGLGTLSYYMDNQAWAPAGGENGDLCVDFLGNNDTTLESTYTVQRSWSDLAAAGGHDPCIPVPPSEIYFNAAPAAAQATVQLKVGETKTVTVDAFSDAPINDWTVSAVDYGRYTGSAAVLDFAWDKSTANNGSHRQLKITLTSRPSQAYVPYAIVSKKGNITHLWPAMVNAR